MTLSLRTATPAEGVRWVRDAFALFVRRPLPYTGMFVAFMLFALLCSLLPWLGSVLMLMSLPLLTLGFMIAGRSGQHDGPVHPGQFIAPLRATNRRRGALVALCALYAIATLLIMQLGDWIDDGGFDKLQQLMAQGDESRAELEALLADPRLTWGLLTRLGLAGLLSVPYWHAPALVFWQGQGVGQALFSSTLAVWRCKGAFLAYSLAWSALVMFFGVAVALFFSLFDARQMAGIIAMPAGLFFSTVFYVSLVFSFDGCFSQSDQDSAAVVPTLQ